MKKPYAQIIPEPRTNKKLQNIEDTTIPIKYISLKKAHKLYLKLKKVPTGNGKD